ncbi:unnamed protein product [Prunus brigantina]
MEVEAEAQVVIVGAGIAGLATSLVIGYKGTCTYYKMTSAWHPKIVLESSDSSRTTGNVTSSTVSGLPIFEMPFKARGKNGTIRFSSKLVHLADGTILKAKVLVGCDGLNSVAAKWLGFKQPAFTGRSAIRGRADFKSPHGFDPIFMRFFGNGVRSGVIPCDDKTVYWYYTWFRYRERLRGRVTVPMQCNNGGHKYEYFLLVQNFYGLLNIIQLPNGESQNICTN